MKKLLNVTGYTEAPKPVIQPAAAYMNLYLGSEFVVGTVHSSPKRARDSRATFPSAPNGGVLVKISRNADGDFLVDAVEEF